MLGISSAVGLLLIFLFQRIDWASFVTDGHGPSIRSFIINRSVRFVLNDIFAVLLIAALFGKKKLVWIAVYAQLLGFVFILLPYIVLKLQWPQYNGPMISFLHRLVLNPLLIYLLIFFFWFQERVGKTQ
jgi:exosortase F-associated protein